MKENILVENFVEYFSKWFDISREVWDDSGAYRIDLILTEKNNNGRVWFGVECKKPGRKRGEKLAKILNQCFLYSNSTWGGKRLPIFLCPAVSLNQLAGIQETKVIGNHVWTRDVHQPDSEHHTINGLLGSFKIGEVRTIILPDKSFYRIFSFSNKIIFSTLSGVHFPNYNFLIKKINRP